jgi:hypothetical protein
MEEFVYDKHISDIIWDRYINNTNTTSLFENILRDELLRAFKYGQRNAEQMEAGLERDESEDYVNYRMPLIKKIYFNNQ